MGTIIGDNGYGHLQHARLAAMLQRNPVHTFMFDDSGSLLFANKAAVRASLHGKPGIASKEYIRQYSILLEYYTPDNKHSTKLVAQLQLSLRCMVMRKAFGICNKRFDATGLKLPEGKPISLQALFRLGAYLGRHRLLPISIDFICLNGFDTYPVGQLSVPHNYLLDQATTIYTGSSNYNL